MFTPSRAPLREHNVYVSRADAERELDSAINQGDTPLIFGEFGVGKTSLALHFFRNERDENRLVHFARPDKQSLDAVFRQALEQIGYIVETSMVEERADSADIGLSAGLWSVFKARLGASMKDSVATSTELYVKSPTDAAVLDALGLRRMILLIDELHQSDDEFRRDLVRLIKTLSDRGADYPKLVLAGTSAQPELLVRLDEGVDRLVREVPVRPLTRHESDQVVRRGFGKLQIALDDVLVDRLVGTAAGAPSLLHTLCLEAAEHVRGSHSDSLNDDAIDEAIQKVVQRHYHRLTERYMKATNTTGSKRYREKILRACAESDADFITMEMLVEKVSLYTGESVPRTRLSEPLRHLKSPDYGDILADVPRIDGEGRHYNLTVFRDPSMKAYVRFLMAIEDQGYPISMAQDSGR
ncbi:ATP-binding protein [Ornithinimicrobium tianjinense]|uniref:ATP-binding protein n=1 Tax=Ornithinimicrobium tianjinense TaxID=1195761 RepID=UPI001667DBA9|nr:ATP-binding protein [Ornithinimicrobium tianjinense]